LALLLGLAAVLGLLCATRALASGSESILHVTVAEPASTVASAAAFTCTLQGTVRDYDGSVVPGVLVTAQPGNHSTHTGPMGVYLMTLDAGTYYVGVFKTGYITPPEQVVSVPPSHAGLDFSFPERFTIHGVIRYFDLRGASGVQVTVFPGEFRATSGASGAYTLTVTAGTYAVSARLRGYVSPPAQSITVPPNRNDVDFTLPRSFLLRGTVRDADGTAVPDVFVTALPGDYTTTTDVRGIYTLTVVAGTYSVSVGKLGYISPPERVVTLPPQQTEVHFVFPARYTIRGTVRDHDRSPVQGVWVSTTPGSFGAWTNANGVYTVTVISGTYEVRVVKADYPAPPARTVSVPPSRTEQDFFFPQRYAISGAVHDFDGEPLADVLITSQPGGYSTFSEPDGSYALRVLTGTYSLSAFLQGYPAPAAQSVTVPPDRSGVDFTFPRRYTIRGTVRDYDGTPLAGLWMTAQPGGCNAQTDALGAYTLTVTEGTYSVSAARPGHPGPAEQVVSAPPDHVGVDFSFVRLYTVRGTVRSSDGSPASDAWVSASPGGSSAWSDAMGAYTLTVSAGGYTVSVTKGGLASPPPQSVSVPPDRAGVDFSFPQSHTIAGRTLDSNGNPVANAWVTAAPGSYSTFSSSGGAYALTVLTGTYSVSASRYGYLNPPTQTVTVPPDRTDVNLVFPQSYVIAGTVRDADGAPLAAAHVVCTGPLSAGAWTDPYGAYTLTVTAGSYQVSVSKGDYPSPPAQTVTVPPSRTDVDLTFSGRCTIAGTVRDHTASPLAGATVSAMPGAATAQTDQNGAYRLTVNGGTYSISVSKTGLPGPSMQTVTVPPSRSDVDFRFPARYTIAGAVRESDGSPVAEAAVLSFGPVSGSAVTDSAGAYALTVISGTYSISVLKDGYPSLPAQVVAVPPSRSDVEFSYPARYAIAGTVRDCDGSPFAEVLITAFPGAYSAWTDANGAYALQVVSGTYSVYATKTGLPGPATREVTLPPDHRDVDFSFPRRYAIRGVVRDSAGNPVPDAWVSVTPGGAGAWTDATGAYTLTVAEGSYRVSVSKSGLRSPPEQAVSVPPERGAVNFAFVEEYTIGGTVRDYDGSPLEGVRIVALPGGYRAFSDATGVYELYVDAGSYTISASKEGYPGPEEQIVIVPPSQNEVDFDFPQRFTICAKVVEYDQAPVPDVTVFYFGPVSGNGQTDATGVCTFTVKAGTYQLSVMRTGYAGLPTQSVNVPPNRCPVTFTYPQRCAIGGTVRDASGNPVQAALVTASPGGYNISTDAVGVYTLTLPCGTYSLGVYKNSYNSPAAQAVTVPPNRYDVDFYFLPSFSIGGEVTEFDGAPVPDAWVIASPTGYATLTDVRGVYTMTVVPGTYSLTVSKEGYPPLPAQTVVVPPSQNNINFVYPARFTISGTVRDYDNTPVADVLMAASPGNYGASTDVNGTYTLTVLAGTYDVSASKFGYPSPPTQSVTVPPGRGGIDFSFPQRYTIAGTVRDNLEAVVPGATVAYSGLTSGATTTDDTGGYTLTVKAGMYSVTASKLGYATAPAQEVTVPPDQLAVNFSLLRVSTSTPIPTRTRTRTPTPTGTLTPARTATPSRTATAAPTATPTLGPTPTDWERVRIFLPVVVRH
jgi:protocatechuate 3,4-dioxygenase beta subunit